MTTAVITVCLAIPFAFLVQAVSPGAQDWTVLALLAAVVLGIGGKMVLSLDRNTAATNAMVVAIEKNTNVTQNLVIEIREAVREIREKNLP